MDRTLGREEAKQETRDALIAAAAHEFAEHGLDAPSLDAICARAGFTRGAFYVHFRDRDDLLLAVMDRFLGAFLDATIASGDDAADLAQTIMRYVGAVASGSPIAAGFGKWRFHHTLEACTRSPKVRERYAGIQQDAIVRVARAARAGQKAGTVRGDVDAAQIATVLVVLTMGVAAMLDARIPFDLTAAGGAVLELFAAKRDGARTGERRRTRRTAR
jgi:TetR/AcrR family transcriptional repressor of nem operon